MPSLRFAAALALVIACAQLLTAAPPSVKVRLTPRDGGKVVELPLEQYVAGVVAGEAGTLQSDEALKAMAVAARTYAVHLRGRHAAQGFDFCATTHCQRLDLRAVTTRIRAAVSATRGELLWYEGKPIFACYTRDCGGHRAGAAEVWPDETSPYLAPLLDPYCTGASGSNWSWSAAPEQIVQALQRSQLRAPETLERIEVVRRTPSGRANVLLLVGGGESVRISASSFRFAIGRALGWNTLRSDLYQIHGDAQHLVFDGRGAGHGAGLCQIGADEMGKSGRSYRKILQSYYPGAVLGLTARGLHWNRLAGELVTVETTRADLDRPVLALADQLCRTLETRTRFTFPDSVRLWIYPDLDTYRNATGEPGWVAAYTAGADIHLQPMRVLRNRGILESTLRHELAHALLENHAGPNTPLWFREGLTEYLTSPAGIVASRGAHTGEPFASYADIDAAIRNTGNERSMRAAYRVAAQRVAALVNRYGETTVLAWLSRGLPPELKNQMASQQPTNNK